MIKIFIDPGHGGKDRSNRGRNGYIEADAVLDIGLKLRDMLLSTGKFDVKMSRTSDKSVGVRERGNMAARWGSDMFISIHTNAYNGKRSGVEVYESVDLPDEKLANDLSFAIAKAMGIPNIGNKSWESRNYKGEDYLGVIDAAQDGGVDHVLLSESGYHDNPKDEALLLKDNIRTAIAKAHFEVICKFYRVRINKPIDKNKFNDDNKISSWAKDSVYKLKELGIIKGHADNNFNPKDPITREECAVIIDRLLNHKGK